MNAFLMVETSFYGKLLLVPIKVVFINMSDIFQVKFEYKQRGYKGLQFSERLSKIQFTK